MSTSGGMASAGTAAATGGNAADMTHGGGPSGAGGAANTGSGGSAGGATGGAASGAGGAGPAAGGADGFTAPGTDGDGDFMIAPPYKSSAFNYPAAGAAFGKQLTFKMESAASTIYPGRKGAYSRSVWLYVPSKYVPGTKAPFMVVQDGYFALWFGNDLPHNANPTGPNLPGTANVPLIVENLVAQGKLPPLAVLLVDNGGGDAEGSERGLEYDTVSGKFAEFIQTEVLPRAVTEAKSQLQIDLAFTDDPRGRGTLGGSSGGAASFSMAWFHPDYFTRVISYSGTFVRQASPEDAMYPHGCWSYHDFDPYQEAAPNGVIMKEPTPKPIRVWLEAGENDNGAGSGPGSYRDFRLANQRMAASLKAKQYHYHFDYAKGAGHVDGNVVAQTLPDAMAWAWRGYPLK
jgi:enterochelin esterase-like enzyme